MAKVKVKDREVELDDDVAELLADETGVPFRNRAAEARRKYEKLEKESAEFKESVALKIQEIEARAKQVQAPYTPGQYTNPNQSQAYYDPRTGQIFYAGNQQAAYNQNTTQGLSAEDARKLAREELQREKQEREYHEESAKFQKEWPNYDDERENVHNYLREIGYEDTQIKNFGPRDLRMVRDAYTAKTKPAKRRSPQEVILDTGGGDGGYLEDSENPWKPGSFDKLDKKAFEKLVGETKMKVRLDDQE